MSRYYEICQTKLAYQKWLTTPSRSVFECYGRMSKDKREAWNHCVSECVKRNGDGLKVIRFNGYCFTAGFTYKRKGREYFYYITKGYERMVEIKEKEVVSDAPDIYES